MLLIELKNFLRDELWRVTHILHFFHLIDQERKFAAFGYNQISGKVIWMEIKVSIPTVQFTGVLLAEIANTFICFGDAIQN